MASLSSVKISLSLEYFLQRWVTPSELLICQPSDYLVFESERAGLAKVQCLREINMPTGFNPCDGKGAGGARERGEHRVSRYERIIATGDQQRGDLKIG